MAGHGEKISRAQEFAIASLLICPTIQDAAKMAGVGERTLSRWMAQDDFEAAYRAARREIVVQAVAQLQGCLSKAIDVLLEVAEDKAAPPSSRVAAARTLIDQTFKATEVEDLATRIEKLEQAIKERPT